MVDASRNTEVHAVTNTLQMYMNKVSFKISLLVIKLKIVNLTIRATYYERGKWTGAERMPRRRMTVTDLSDYGVSIS